jgi:hypothetical protein
MNSVDSFNEQQQKDFKLICADFGGPTSTGYVLDVMERAIYALEANPELDPSCFKDKELLNEVLVCMSALEFCRMRALSE